MLLIATIHILWLMLLPLGLFLVTAGILKRPVWNGPLWAVAGVVAIIVSLPAYPICKTFFPFDFFIPGRKTTVSVEIPDYTVTLVEKPGGDFYDLDFEIVRSDGTIAKIMVDCDANKCWNPRTVEKGGIIYFLRNSTNINNRTSYVDPANGIIYGGWYMKTNVISELSFL